MNPTIKEIRRELGITQKQMGRLMGMPQSCLSPDRVRYKA